jgi:cytochrome b6-f complex iron-sulfur subunit
MADKLADLSGEEREKRVAELKAKMQASAQKNKSAAAAATPETATPVAAVAPVIEAPAAVAPPAPTATNGTAAVASMAEPLIEEETAERRAQREMSRRELLTYAWGASLGLLGVTAGVGTFMFMMPRFKAGEFGGDFFLGPESSMPPTDAPPQAEVAGKFWLVNTVDEGPKALYMVCTHLGCLYKWEASNLRFECPCHGSKFSREGFYIEGPAPRSLDRFDLTVENGEVTVHTGKKLVGAPAGESPARAAV